MALITSYSRADDFTTNIVAGLVAVAQTVVDTLHPINQMRTEPTNANISEKVLICEYVSSDVSGYSVGYYEATHAFKLSLLRKAVGDGSDERDVRSYVGPMIKAFADNPDANGTCVWARVTHVDYGPVGWSGQLYYGAIFTLSVDDHTNY